MIKMSENTIDSSNSNIRRIIKGSLISFVITLILLIIFSAVLTYSSLSENIIPMVIIAITGISILIGSQMCTKHIKKNGLSNGGCIGLIYILVMYLLSSIVSGNFTLNIYSILMIIICIISGALGGILGVNMK